MALGSLPDEVLAGGFGYCDARTRMDGHPRGEQSVVWAEGTTVTGDVSRQTSGSQEPVYMVGKGER